MTSRNFRRTSWCTGVNAKWLYALWLTVETGATETRKNGSLDFQRLLTVRENLLYRSVSKDKVSGSHDQEARP